MIRLFAAGLATVLLLWSAAAESGAAERWLCASTSHFALYSTADRDAVLQTARELERMAEILRMWGLGSRLAVRQRVVLLAFPDQKTFKRHWYMFAGRKVSSAGYVSTLPFGRWIGYDESDAGGRATAHHEYAHTLVFEEFGVAPPCINEGLAEYLSTFTAQSDRVEFGHDVYWHRYTVSSGPLFSMDEMFDMRYDSPVYLLGGEERYRFYAESWGLVQYLTRTSGTWPQFRQLAREITSGRPARQAFAAAYPQESWDGLERRIRSFLGNAPEPKQIGFGSPLSEVRVDLRDAPRAEALAQIALWRSTNPGLDTAATAGMIQEALSLVPGLPLARATRGVMTYRSGPQGGIDEMRAASAPGTTDPLALSVAGLVMMFEAVRRDSTGQDPLLREAGDTLERSVSIDSTDARALAGYVECRARSGAVTPLVIQRLVRVAPAVPDDPDIQRMRAQIRGHE